MTARWLHSLFGKQYQRVTTSRRRTGPLAVECLETRELPAASLTAVLTPDGLLRVEGTEFADTIHVRQDAGRISIVNAEIAMATGVHASVEAAQIRKIEVFGLGGDDVVRMDQGTQAIALPTLLDGGAGNDILCGGAGTDTFAVGNSERERVFGFGASDLLAFTHPEQVRKSAVRADGQVVQLLTNDSLFLDGSPILSKIKDFAMADTWLFALRGDGVLMRTEDGQPGTWVTLSGNIAQLAVTPDAQGQVAAFIRDNDGWVYQLATTGQQRSPHTRAKQMLVAPDANSQSALFIRDTDGWVYKLTTAGWQWDENRIPITQMVVAPDASGHDALFTLNRDGWICQMTPSGWQWTATSKPVTKILLAPDTSGQVALVIQDRDNWLCKLTSSGWIGMGTTKPVAEWSWLRTQAAKKLCSFAMATVQCIN